jgi:hypothetical protein
MHNGHTRYKRMCLNLHRVRDDNRRPFRRSVCRFRCFFFFKKLSALSSTEAVSMNIIPSSIVVAAAEWSAVQWKWKILEGMKWKSDWKRKKPGNVVHFRWGDLGDIETTTDDLNARVCVSLYTHTFEHRRSTLSSRQLLTKNTVTVTGTRNAALTLAQILI